MKYGVQLFSLRKYLKDSKSYQQVFATVKDMGAQVVQVSCTMGGAYDADALSSASHDCDLPICVTHSPYERIVNDIDALAREHQKFGCAQIGIGKMPKKFRENNFALLNEFIDSLNSAAQSLEKYGMSIAYHNHWFEFDKIEGGSVFDRLIGQTAPSVQFIPDTYWIKIGGEIPQEFIKRLDGRVTTLHLKDYKRTLGIPLFRAPGKGVLDFVEIDKVARDIGVQYSVVELDMSPNPYKNVEQGLKYVLEVLDK